MIYSLGKFFYIQVSIQHLLLLMFSHPLYLNGVSTINNTISKILFQDSLFNKIDGRINNYNKQVTKSTNEALRILLARGLVNIYQGSSCTIMNKITLLND